MRLAWFSPLRPVRSGISDYSEHVLPELARHARIDVFVDDYKPVVKGEDAFEVKSYRQFDAAAKDYDAVLYHMGNHYRFHRYIYKALKRYPGIVVLHDPVLNHFFQKMTLEKGNYAGYVGLMRYCYGDEGERAARQLITGDADPYIYPMVREVVDASGGTVVHNSYSRDIVLRESPGARVSKANLPYRDDRPLGDKSMLREKYKIDQDSFVVASFGHMVPAKRLDVALRAFRSLKDRVPSALYLLVGPVSRRLALRRLVRELDLADNTRVLGFVNPAEFDDYIDLSDMCVNLRYPTGGETSAALIRLMARGRPVAVTNFGQYMEFPDECCIKVGLGDAEEETLFEKMAGMAEDTQLRAQVGQDARSYVQLHHSPERYARVLADFVTEVAGDLVAHASAESGSTVEVDPFLRRMVQMFKYNYRRVSGQGGLRALWASARARSGG